MTTIGIHKQTLSINLMPGFKVELTRYERIGYKNTSF